MNKDKVTTKIFQNNNWVEIEFTELKDGDRFQLINPDGTFHKDEYRETDWIADGLPYLNKDDIWQINIK